MITLALLHGALSFPFLYYGSFSLSLSLFRCLCDIVARFWENVFFFFFFSNTDIKWKVFIMSVYTDAQRGDGGSASACASPSFFLFIICLVQFLPAYCRGVESWVEKNNLLKSPKSGNLRQQRGGK